jgi:hypothetical protein
MKIPHLPPKKIVLMVRYFHLTLATILLLSTLFFSGCTTYSNVRSQDVSWRSSSAAPSKLLSQAMSENTNLPASEAKQVLVASIPTQDQGKQLYLFNYNTPTLCGKFGCLYTAYLDEGQGKYKQVWGSYLHSELPPGKSLMSVNVTDSRTTIPCFDVQQTTRQGLQKLIYCFNGINYQPTESTLLKLP